MNISVSMIVMNEEKNIERALASCTFADEIVVVDGGSTDRTVEILKAHPRVKLFHHPMPSDFGKQRQISLNHCTGDWVIRLDADEAFSQEFEDGVRSLLQSTPPDVGGCKIRQCNLVGNEEYYSKTFDDYEAFPRIWRNLPEVKWDGAIHEALTGITGRIALWDCYVVHYGFLDKRRYQEKGKFYSQFPGSGFNNSEDLFFREYDIQPRPSKARTGHHIPPFKPEEDSQCPPRIAIIRGPNLNLWEMQNYEPLMDSFDITAYTTTQPNFDLEKIKLPIVKLPSHPQNPAYMQGLEFALFDKDLIYTADITWIFSYQAILAKEKFGKKVVCLEWENIPFAYEENDQMKALKARVRQGADHFIAVTERAKDALILEGVPSDKITVIPMGIDIERFKPDRLSGQELRKELKIRSEEKVILFTGRMVWEKGIFDLIHAAKLSLQDINGMPVKFVIVGKGPETEMVKIRVRELGIDSSVIFIEGYPYHEMHKMYNMADIFVLPSISTRMWKEQFGMVLIEAMACGTPVISTTSGSIPEVVVDAGILVQSNDPTDLAKAIVKLLKDDNLRKELCRKGRERSVEEFDSRKISQRIGRLFENILQPVKESHLSTEKPAGYFSQERPEILQVVPEEAKRVLDVGCGAGHLGKRLKERGVEEVAGIEINPEAATEAKKYLDHVILGDVEETDLPFGDGYFDAIIFADVLEHLRNPKDVLNKYTRYLSDNGAIIASIPNVRYFGVINQLVEGRWRYEDFGILDKDHLRFFTLKEMQEMMESGGLVVGKTACNVDPKFNQIKATYPADINIGRITLKGMSEAELKDLFVIQYILVAQKANKGKESPSILHEGGLAIMLDENRLEEALLSYKASFERDPEDLQCLEHIVKIAQELNHPEVARGYLNKYLQLHPACPEVLLSYGDICLRMGLIDTALESVEKILLFDSGHIGGIDLRNRIEENIEDNSQICNDVRDSYNMMFKKHCLSITLPYWERHLSKKMGERWLKGQVLDIGCGSGEIDVWLARKGIDVTGIDISDVAIQIANIHRDQEPEEVKTCLRFLQGRIDDLPFHDRVFDSCFLSHVLEHIVNVSDVLKEVARVLRPDGKALIVTPIGMAMDDPTHVHYFTEETLKWELLEYAKDVEVIVFDEEKQLVAIVSDFNDHLRSPLLSNKIKVKRPVCRKKMTYESNQGDFDYSLYLKAEENLRQTLNEKPDAMHFLYLVKILLKIGKFREAIDYANMAWERRDEYKCKEIMNDIMVECYNGNRS